MQSTKQRVNNMTPDEFRAMRLKRGLSQKGMAKFLGLKSDRAVRYYESGKREISGPVIRVIELNRLLELAGEE